jgi:hypothetical protein
VRWKQPQQPSCTGLGFDAGTLTCDNTCQLQVTSCVIFCGNGAVDAGEQCDGNNLNNQSCITRGFDAGALLCDSTCDFDTSACIESCGNGQLDAGEQCDGANVNGQSCSNFGFDGGTLTCNAGCLLTTVSCANEICNDNLDNDLDGLSDCADPNCTNATNCQTCGNGQLNAGEQCDGTNLNNQSCLTQGFDGGALSCNNSCFFNITGCADELCTDNLDNDFDGQIDCADASCVSNNACNELGECSDNLDNDFDGQVDCSDVDCANDAACLPFCGDGLINQAGEQCEGANLNGQSCQSLGFISGSITCSAACTFEVTACIAEVCNDGLDNNNNNLTDCQDPVCASDPLCASGVETFCEDFTDNDGDSLVDCEDPTACQTLPACTPGNTSTGGTCATANQCQANNTDPFCINDGDLNINFPGGYCSQFCNVAANDCGDDGVCVNINLASGNGLCLDGCTINNNCRVGYSCQAIGAARVCILSENCTNGVEDDIDGQIDCADADCAEDAACAAFVELEPNNISAQANPFTNSFFAQISPVGDVDFVSVTTTVANTVITAEIGDGGSGECALRTLDSDIAIIDRNGTTVLGFNDDINGATNFCSRVSAVAVIPGTYFIRARSSLVFQPNDTFSYQLFVTLRGLAEVESNNTAGLADPFVEPFFARINPAGDIDFISVTTTVANTTITAEVADLENGQCLGSVIDPEVTIFDRNGTTQLAFNDDINATNFCSRVSAVAVIPGTYFIQVRSSVVFTPNGLFDYRALITLQ